MQFWTIQTLEAWERACEIGSLRASPLHVPAAYRSAYEWMARQMAERIGPAPSGVEFPVWAWYQWGDSKHCKPDLRSSGHLLKGVEGVRLEFHVDSAHVLLSLFEEWHFVLNYWYLYPSIDQSAYDPQDLEFDKALYDAGLSYYTTKPLLDLALHRQMEQSWERIFSVARQNPSADLVSLSAAPVQATLWDVPTSSVTRVTFFTGR